MRPKSKTNFLMSHKNINNKQFSHQKFSHQKSSHQKSSHQKSSHQELSIKFSVVKLNQVKNGKFFISVTQKTFNAFIPLEGIRLLGLQ